MLPFWLPIAPLKEQRFLFLMRSIAKPDFFKSHGWLTQKYFPAPY